MSSCLRKSAPARMTVFIVLILLAGCHGERSSLERAPGSGGAGSERCPPPASMHPRVGPVEGEPVTAQKENWRPGVPATGLGAVEDGSSESIVSISVLRVEDGGSAGRVEMVERDGKQAHTYDADMQFVFHNPRNSPYIQTTPDGGLDISWDSTGQNGETANTLLNEPVTVSMLFPAQSNPFREYGSGENEGVVRVSLTGSLSNCVHALMNHGVMRLSLGSNGSLVRKDWFIVGVLSLENEEGKLVSYNVAIPRKTVPCRRAIPIEQ